MKKAKRLSLRKKQKMPVFKRIISWLHRNYVEKNEKDGGFVVGLSSRDFPSPTDMNSSPKLNFKIFTANGGYIVEFYKYDYKKDEQSTELYIIPSTDELTESISLICQREFLNL